MAAIALATAAFFIAVFTAATGALAQEPCGKTSETALVEALAGNPGAYVHETLGGADAERVAAAFNIIPPVTAIEADRVEVLRSPFYQFYALIFSFEGCLTGSGQIPPWVYEQMKAVPRPVGLEI